MFYLPPVTQALLIINVLVFGAEALLGNSISSSLALWPLGPQFMPWQVLTYAFVHAGFSHLLFNMVGLYMFGGDVERIWGPLRFLSFYLTCALSAAAWQLVVSSLTGAYYPTVGASGAVFGLLLAYARSFPNR